MLNFLPFKQVRTGARVSNEEILDFAQLFNDELTLDNISRLVGVGGATELQLFGLYPFFEIMLTLEPFLQASVSEHVQIYGYHPIWYGCTFAFYASKEIKTVS